MKELNGYKYRLCTMDDIDEVMAIIEDGRELLKEEGNGQWQFGYPNRDDLVNDIKKQELYCLLNDDKLASIFALTGYEESYMHFYEGWWKTDYDYLVIHRIATKKECRGLGYGYAMFLVAIEVTKEKGYHSLRIDTHKNNHILLHLMEKTGFEYCGKAILPPNKDRVMYEKII